MKKKWHINWLVVITVVLFISALGLFIPSFQESLGLTKCAYGDIIFNDGQNCICNNKGKVVCDQNEDISPIKSEEFTAKNLSFSSSFQSLITSSDSFVKDVRFVNISQVGNSLKVVVEKKTLCNGDNDIAPEVGFYKADEEKIIFMIGRNLYDNSFNTACISEATFELVGTPAKFVENFKIYYQDEYGSLTPSDNCSYQGVLRNEGDVYNSSDKCSLCVCRLGQNICEQEKRCLE